ncbi:MAG: ATP-binding protein, partial [Alphaproteobacteria bacterium]
DMPVLLGDVAASWRARLGSPARLDLDVAADAPPILEGDRRALQRILDNLLSNAQHYAGDGARIELSWSVLPGGGASLTVRDDGPGIPAEQIPNLAEPFYQGGTDHDRHSEQARQSSGHGLGLSIVRRLAELHGGALRIESVQGQGASFAVTFPADRLSWQWQAPPAPAGAGKGPPDGGSAAAG